MRFTLTTYILMIGLAVNAQTVLTIEKQTYTNADDTWMGVNIPRTIPTTLTFRNNSILSANRYGYMLQAGDETVANTNNNLNDEIITGNKFTWTGSDMKSITHGLFNGNSINAVIKYNYLDHVPMGIISKSSSNMSNTAGGIAYNIIKSGAVGINIKGMSNVNVFNNTLYTDRTTSETWRGLVYIYTNIDLPPHSVSHGTKIYNNIFYTKYKTYCIQIDNVESTIGLESDYNIFYCESGTPVFSYCGSVKTFAEWQALGYDIHSKVINPNFKDYVYFVPASRLDYGKDLGLAWAKGLSLNARWSTTDPETATQNGKWQVGAIVYAATVVNSPPVVFISSPSKTTAFKSPATITIEAIASDPDGTINKVEFYSSNTKIGERTSLPFSFTWKDVAEGTYSITAIATDNSNSNTVSMAVPVVVEKAVVAVNQLPSVYITSPGNATSFLAPTTLSLTADASDADGTIIKVEYFTGSLKIGESFSAPFQVPFECKSAGEYDITAIATDNLNAVTSSSVLKLYFNSIKEYPDLINLFPNPNYGRFSIDLSSSIQNGENTVTIISLTGQTVYYGILGQGEHSKQFDISQFGSGNYVVVISSGKQIVTTKKFIKN